MPEPLVLWAWERPVQLGFLRPGDASVAGLLATIRISDSGISVIGRRQPLAAAPGVDWVPVARIEVASGTTKDLLETHADALVEILVDLARGASSLQLDFDARRWARPFYTRLLWKLRRALPSATRLSITALASWCFGDPWLKGVPIDEAVPMLFRMGPEGPSIRSRLARGEDFPAEVCRAAYGISTDETIPPLRSDRRVYVFSSRPWSAEAYAGVRHRLEEARQ
jgi:hypothetical protein